MADDVKNRMEGLVNRLNGLNRKYVGRAEPLAIIEGLKFDNMLLRAQLNALTDIMVIRGNVDSNELQKRTIDQLERMVEVLDQALGKKRSSIVRPN